MHRGLDGWESSSYDRSTCVHYPLEGLLVGGLVVSMPCQLVPLYNVIRTDGGELASSAAGSGAAAELS